MVELNLNEESILYKIEHDNGKIQYLFYCDGCKCCHAYDERWQFNGDMDKPTFKPSLLNTKPNNKEYRCHLFLINGKIKYLNDCHHDLAGNEIDLPKF